MIAKAMDNIKQDRLMRNLFNWNLKLLSVTVLLSIIFSILYDFLATWSVKSILKKIVTGGEKELLKLIIYFIVIIIGAASVGILLKYLFVILKKRGIAAIEDRIIREYYGFKGQKNSSKFFTVIQNSVPNLVQGFFDFVSNSL